MGNVSLRVSQLALGTMTFGNNLSRGADDSVSRQIFDAYLKVGETSLSVLPCISIVAPKKY